MFSLLLAVWVGSASAATIERIPAWPGARPAPKLSQIMLSARLNRWGYAAIRPETFFPNLDREALLAAVDAVNRDEPTVYASLNTMRFISEYSKEDLSGAQNDAAGIVRTHMRRVVQSVFAELGENDSPSCCSASYGLRQTNGAIPVWARPHTDLDFATILWSFRGPGPVVYVPRARGRFQPVQIPEWAIVVLNARLRAQLHDTIGIVHHAYNQVIARRSLGFAYLVDTALLPLQNESYPEKLAKLELAALRTVQQILESGRRAK